MKANTMMCPSELLALAYSRINPTNVCSTPRSTPSTSPWNYSSLTIVPSQISSEKQTQHISPELIVISDDESKKHSTSVDYVVLSESDSDLTSDLVQIIGDRADTEVYDIETTGMESFDDSYEGLSECVVNESATLEGDTRTKFDSELIEGLTTGGCLTVGNKPQEINEGGSSGNRTDRTDRTEDLENTTDSNTSEFLPIFHMLQSILSPQIAPDYTNFEEYIQQYPYELAAKHRTRPVFPFRKDPRLVFKSSTRTGFGRPTKKNQTSGEQHLVTLRLVENKEYAEIIVLSGPDKEFKLPVFSTLKPLRKLVEIPEYQSTHKLADNDIEVMENSAVTIKRYDCRITLAQMAIVLGLQDYRVSLMKYIDEAIFQMLDQLCGFRVGVQKWSRGTPLKERKDMIIKVTRFLRVYFPMLTPELVELIIKRGFYCRMQQHLKRKRLGKSSKYNQGI